MQGKNMGHICPIGRSQVKGSPDEGVGPYICRIFSEVHRIHAKYIA